MVLTLEFLGIRPIRACVGGADSVEWYARRYSRLLRTVVHIDVQDGPFILAHRSTQTIYRLAKSHSAGAVRGDSDCVSRSTRPASSVYRDRLERAISITQSYTKHAKGGPRSEDRSARVKLSLIQSSTSSPRASPQASGFFPAYQGVKLDPRPSIEARSDRDPCAYVPPLSDDGSEPPVSHAHVSALDSSKQAYDLNLRQAACLLAGEFPDTPSLARRFRDSKLNKKRITSLTLEALTQRRKSPASTRGVIKNVSGAIQFFLDTRDEADPAGFTLTGEASVALLHDYLESVADRGCTVPGAVKTSLITWSEALGAPRPLVDPLFRAVAQVESSEIQKHAPPMKLDTIRKLESMALSVEIDPFRRAFASGILLMTYASLRFSDVQRRRIIEVGEDSVRGTLLRSKTKESHGTPWPWAIPLMGVSGSTEWAHRLIEFHVVREKQNAPMPSFVFPMLNHRWELEKSEPAAYANTRRKLSLACA